MRSKLWMPAVLCSACVLLYLAVGGDPGNVLGSTAPLNTPNQERQTPRPAPTPPPVPLPKIVIAVFPSTVNPGMNSKRVEAIAETWGKAVQVVYLGHGEFVLPDALREKHQGNTEVIRWAATRCLELWPDLQWWMKADDLTFVLPGNLQAYLAGRRYSDVELLGRRLQMPSGEVFCSGGAGYVLSRAALDYIIGHWETCEGKGWFREQGGDIAFAQCLPPGAVADTREEGRERFHAYGPQRLMSGKVDKWYRDYTKPWYDIPEGTQCCAPRPLTFHYVEYGEARVLHDVFAHPDKYRAMNTQQRLDTWPTGEALSYYSTKPALDDPMWDLLLRHFAE